CNPGDNNQANNAINQPDVFPGPTLGALHGKSKTAFHRAPDQYEKNSQPYCFGHVDSEPFAFTLIVTQGVSLFYNLILWHCSSYCSWWRIAEVNLFFGFPTSLSKRDTRSQALALKIHLLLPPIY